MLDGRVEKKSNNSERQGQCILNHLGIYIKQVRRSLNISCGSKANRKSVLIVTAFLLIRLTEAPVGQDSEELCESYGPVIQVISDDALAYVSSTSDDFQVVGFDWDLGFTCRHMSPLDTKRPGAPVRFTIPLYYSDALKPLLNSLTVEAIPAT